MTKSMHLQLYVLLFFVVVLFCFVLFCFLKQSPGHDKEIFPGRVATNLGNPPLELPLKSILLQCLLEEALPQVQQPFFNIVAIGKN